VRLRRRAAPGELFSRWKARFGVEILDGIGSTEVLQHLHLAAAGKREAGSTGVPVGGYEVRIIDESGADVPRGEAGDLIVRGPSTATQYFNRRSRPASKMRGAWFVTGGQVPPDRDGEYHYVAAPTTCSSGGEWVSPTDVERRWSRTPRCSSR